MSSNVAQNPVPPSPAKLSFFWDTQLSEERRAEINSWVSTLDIKQLTMLTEIVADAKAEAEWEVREGLEGLE